MRDRPGAVGLGDVAHRIGVCSPDRRRADAAEQGRHDRRPAVGVNDAEAGCSDRPAGRSEEPAELPAVIISAENPSYLPSAPHGSKGVVYLTFDDGPSLYTHSVLQILTRTGSTATFFELGDNQQVYPKLPAAVRAQGSTIGNHTYDHKDLTMMSNAAIESELQRGPKGAHCARPPYGATTPRVRGIINSMGMTQMLWSNDTSDWSRPGSEVIYLRAAGPHVGNGSVVLMHDGGGPRTQTVAALPKIIAELQRRGYLIRKLPGC